MKHSSKYLNPHYKQPTSLVSLGKILWLNRQLIAQMAKGEIMGRYKGSIIGLAWSFFNPILMLMVYTFVFSVIFKGRWGLSSEDSNILFAVIIFVGMIVHGMFSEVLIRSPSLIVANVNYVKKLVFPLEILPVVSISVALFHSLINLIALLIVFVLLLGYLHWTVIFFPLIFLPFVTLTLGLAWMLSTIGVFLRDVFQFTSIVTTVMLFLSPTFYPLSAVPEQYVPFIMANPLTFIVQEAREVLIWGHLPNFLGLAIYTLLSALVGWAGFAFFQKAKKGFADVL